MLFKFKSQIFRGNVKTALAAAVLFGTIILSGCQKDENQPSLSTGLNENQVSVAKSSNPNDFKHYSEEWWEWNLSYDCAHFPLTDPTGALQSQGQHGAVYFLSGGQFNNPVVRNVTIPRNKSIFISLISIESNDTTGMAASGMSLKDYLTAGATGAIDGVDILSCTLDGNAVPYSRAQSKVFNFSANGDLATCFDNIITGHKQPFVTDGYWAMINPLCQGQHLLHFTGGLSANIHHPLLLIDVTYNITVN